jgi:hypothetical protein
LHQHEQTVVHIASTPNEHETDEKIGCRQQNLIDHGAAEQSQQAARRAGARSRPLQYGHGRIE